MEKESICPVCEVKYYTRCGPSCDCQTPPLKQCKQEQHAPQKDRTLIPDQNIRAWLHIYRLLKEEIEDHNFSTINPHDRVILERKRRQDRISRDQYLKEMVEISKRGIEEYDGLNPFRHVKDALRRHWDDAFTCPDRSRYGSLMTRHVQSWGLNILVFAIHADMRYHTGRSHYPEICEILNNEGISTDFDEFSLKRHIKLIRFSDVMEILDRLNEACQEMKTLVDANLMKPGASAPSFFPEDIAIQETPIDFLVMVADWLGIKENPLFRKVSIHNGVQHITTELPQGERERLKELYENRNRGWISDKS